MEKGLISIDRWGEDSRAYFSTHLHADHTVGLSPKWSRGPLFCSPVSAALFPSKFPGFDMSLIRVLDVGSTASLSLVSPTSGVEVSFRVTAIDAHHCPGALMYLFRGEFGCVLHTGDFRWEPNSRRAQLGKKTLREALGGDSIDVLYLDNTYCNPSFSFPPRNVAAQQIIDIISGHPEHEIIIGIDTLGKEELLLKIAEALNMKIWVWPERLRTMHLLGLFDVFTTKTSLTRVRAVPRYNVTFNTLEALNTVHPTIGIMPSGLPWVDPASKDGGSLGHITTKSHEGGRQAQSQTDMKGDHQYLYSVPYSCHSCFSEIQEFMKIVRPSIVTGIVSSSICYINPRHYFRRLCGASHLFYKPFLGIENEVGAKAEAEQSGSVPVRRRSSKLKSRREAKFKFASLSVRRSRVCILRRRGHGVKIAEAVGKHFSGSDGKNHMT